MSILPNEEKSKIYVLAIQILFGIIIGISFIDYEKELVPFNPNFETVMIFVAYATVLMSLVGYSIAANIRPHQNISRFIIDVILLYFYFELVYSPKYSFEYYLIIFPVIFGLYIPWQVLEWYEYRNAGNDKRIPRKRFLKTIGYTVGVVIGFVVIYYYYDNLPSKIQIISNNIIKLQYSAPIHNEGYILGAIFGLVILFRILLWKFR